MKKILFAAIALGLVILASGCGHRKYYIDFTEATETEPMVSTKPVSDNPLIAAELEIKAIRNGSGTETIGMRACVNIPKETLKKITTEEYAEFCDEVVDHSIYNWVSISCDDGTGIQFTGSQFAVATYGTMSYEGIVIKDLGYIKQIESGFKFEACE